MTRIAPLILALCALVVAALPGAAKASADQSMTFEAPVDLANPATRTQAFDEISSFGVKSVRIVMLWQNVAPASSSRVKPDFDATDPTKYDWSAYDPQIDGAIARGWNVLLTLSGPVPRWVTNGDPPATPITPTRRRPGRCSSPRSPTTSRSASSGASSRRSTARRRRAR